MNFPDASETQRKKVIPIDKGWHFKQTEIKSNYHFAADWLPVSQFPTNVHLDLLHHNLIPDPFIGKNETKVQWVGETTWVYKTIFNCPVLQPGARADLVFQGLDTIATVNLNGTKILQTDNMFVPERVDITNVVKGTPVREFELVIVFESAYLRGWERVEEHPDHKWGCWNGDNSRLAVRKAQYHWVSTIWSNLSFEGLALTCLGLGLGSYLIDLWSMEARYSRDLRVPIHRS